MTPLQIKLAIYAAMALIIIGSYLAWEHHVKSIQSEIDRAEVLKRDADTARQSAELMAAEKSRVEQSNNEQTERLKNAVTIYAARATELNADVDHLTKRLRNNSSAASCGKDSVPGTSNDNPSGKRSDSWTDQEISEYAQLAITLENELERKVNELKVK